MSCDHVIQTMITPVRKGKNTGAPGVNMSNLVPLGDKKRWIIPGILTLNARSLSADKSDELLTVANLNDVSCVCVTETWFKDYISSDVGLVGLTGFSCERKDREGRGGGGVACYVKEIIEYSRIKDIEADEHEVLGIKMRPRKLPRKFSCIVIACIYHPPDALNSPMRDYL